MEQLEIIRLVEEMCEREDKKTHALLHMIANLAIEQYENDGLSQIPAASNSVEGTSAPLHETTMAPSSYVS
jgi:hypothetical protein